MAQSAWKKQQITEQQGDAAVAAMDATNKARDTTNPPKPTEGPRVQLERTKDRLMTRYNNPNSVRGAIQPGLINAIAPVTKPVRPAPVKNMQDENAARAAIGGIVHTAGQDPKTIFQRGLRATLAKR